MSSRTIFSPHLRSVGQFFRLTYVQEDNFFENIVLLDINKCMIFEMIFQCAIKRHNSTRRCATDWERPCRIIKMFSAEWYCFCKSFESGRLSELPPYYCWGWAGCCFSYKKMFHNIFFLFFKNYSRKKIFVNLKKSIGCPTRAGFMERNEMSKNRSERAAKNCQNSPRIFRNDKMTKKFFYFFL